MSNSVVWNIVQMDYLLPLGTTPPNGQVTSIHWTASLTDESEEHTVSCYGQQTLAEPDPNNYIPYEDIGKTRSIQWVETAIGNQRKEEIVRKGLEEIWGTDLEIDFFIDEDIIGGVILQVEDKFFDGSISGKLKQINNII